MSTSINFVTKLKEILFIAEVNGDGGNTLGYNSTSTEGYLACMFKHVLLFAVILGFLGTLIYITSKQIFT